MQNVEGHPGIKWSTKLFWDDLIGHVIWQPSCFVIFKPSKIFFSEMAEPVITYNIYEVAVLMMSLINYVTHQYTNSIQNTPHKTSPGEGLQSLVALFLVFVCFFVFFVFFLLSVIKGIRRVSSLKVK